jgi:hypothetical protein
MGDCCSKEEATPVERGGPASVSVESKQRDRARERDEETMALVMLTALFRVRCPPTWVQYLRHAKMTPEKTLPILCLQNYVSFVIFRLWEQNQDDRFQLKIHRQTSPLRNCTKWANRYVIVVHVFISPQTLYLFHDSFSLTLFMDHFVCYLTRDVTITLHYIILHYTFTARRRSLFGGQGWYPQTIQRILCY